MSKRNKPVLVELKYTDLVHEVRDGVVYDVYLNEGKEVKAVVSNEQ